MICEYDESMCSLLLSSAEIPPETAFDYSSGEMNAGVVQFRRNPWSWPMTVLTPILGASTSRRWRVGLGGGLGKIEQLFEVIKCLFCLGMSLE